MTIQQQIRDMLWEAFPIRSSDTKESWFNWVASSSEGRSVGWKPRRVRALFRCEARVVTAQEWKTINERLNAAKLRERQMEEQVHDQRGVFRRGMGEDMSLGARENPSLPFSASAGSEGSSEGRPASRLAKPHSEE